MSHQATDDQAAHELLEKANAEREKLLNFFIRLGVSSYESEDLVQETLVRVWRYRDQYQETAKLTTFLFLLARQVRIDALRRRIRRVRREETWFAERPQATPAPNYLVREDVLQALATLPEAMREVVELGLFQDLPYAEVAEILAIPVGTVKSRMFNALKKLKEYFDDN